MALIKKDPIDDPLNRLIDWRIFEDNVGRLSTQLESISFVRPRHRTTDRLSNSGRTSKRNLIDARMLHQSLSGFTVSADNVHHSCWKFGIFQQLRQFQRGERRGLSGLQHHRVATSQGRSDFPGRHQEREIPRNDLPYHTQRLRFFPRKGVVQFIRPSGVIEKVCRGQRNIDIATLANWLSAIHRFDDGKLPGSFLQKASDPKEILPTLRPGDRRPFSVVGFAGGLHRLIDFFFPRR